MYYYKTFTCGYVVELLFCYLNTLVWILRTDIWTIQKYVATLKELCKIFDKKKLLCKIVYFITYG